MQFCEAQVRAVKAKNGTMLNVLRYVQERAVLTYRLDPNCPVFFFTSELPSLGFQQRA